MRDVVSLASAVKTPAASPNLVLRKPGFDFMGRRVRLTGIFIFPVAD
jgi:hypothetical protein